MSWGKHPGATARELEFRQSVLREGQLFGLALLGFLQSVDLFFCARDEW